MSLSRKPCSPCVRPRSSPAPQPEVAAKAYNLQSPISTTYASAITIGGALAKVNASRAVGRMCGTTWLQSPGHCRNIMNARYKDYGVSVAYKSGSRYGTYWTQNFGVRF